MKLRDAIRDLVPPVVLRAVRAGSSRGIRFEGDYQSWQAAVSASRGYDHSEIVRRVYEAELKVKSGEAADARDGVVFDAVQFSYPIIAGLARIVAVLGRPLRVLDFGGAFGGVRRQYRALGLPGPLWWRVVEQRAFVDLGRQKFESGDLRFFVSIEEAISDENPDVMLLSSVLQYLEHPYKLIDRAVDARIPNLIIDRTPCWGQGRDRLTVQKVPAHIYSASYPCWIFSWPRILAAVETRYRVISRFVDSSGPWRGTDFSFELGGLLLERKHDAGC